MADPVDPVDRAAEANARFRPVETDGETVTRPATEATPTVHQVLRHLRESGLDGVPEPLGGDGSRERLAFVAGESGGRGWYHQHTDDGLASAARYLRRVHDATAGWTPPAPAVWGAPEMVTDETVLCHGDPGPWNFVWRDHQVVGLIDWDYLHPGPRTDDVA